MSVFVSGSATYPHLEEKEIESRQVYQGRLLDVRCDRVMTPDGHEVTREFVRHQCRCSGESLPCDLCSEQSDSHSYKCDPNQILLTGCNEPVSLGRRDKYSVDKSCSCVPHLSKGAIDE